MKQTNFEIVLKYYGGIYNEKELEEQIEILKKNQFNISTYDQNGIYMNSIEPSIISIFISQSFVQNYLSQLLADATWAAFNKFIIWATKFQKNSEKKLYKTTSDKVEEIEPIFGLNIDVGNNRKIDFQINGELSDSQKEKCIQSAFEYIKSLPPLKQPSIEIARYDVDKNTWTFINYIDECIKNKK